MRTLLLLFLGAFFCAQATARDWGETSLFNAATATPPALAGTASASFLSTVTAPPDLTPMLNASTAPVLSVAEDKPQVESDEYSPVAPGVVGRLYNENGQYQGTLRRQEGGEVVLYGSDGQAKFRIQQNENGDMDKHLMTDEPFVDTFAGKAVRQENAEPLVPGALSRPVFQLYDQAGSASGMLELRPLN